MYEETKGDGLKRYKMEMIDTSEESSGFVSPVFLSDDLDSLLPGKLDGFLHQSELNA